MREEELLWMPATELVRRMRRREISPVEVVGRVLERVERVNPKLNAFLTVDREGALAAARAAEAAYAEGGELPPLLGVPVSVKDLVYTKGLRTTGGSLAYQDLVPEFDAVVVERLRRAGAVILGKTNTPEFGLAPTTENRLGDECRNPWDIERTSGGSSGGAGAAVAAGLGPLAVGTDGGGSIRIPAAFCGVFGFKPTYGTVPAYGGFGGMPLFSHVGPLARTVRDAALFLNATAGYDGRDPRARRTRPRDFGARIGRKLGELRVAWSPDLGLAPVEPEVLERVTPCARTFEELGCRVEAAAPAPGPTGPFLGRIIGADGYAAQGHILDERPELLTDYARESMERGKAVSGKDYSLALRELEAYRARMADFFEAYDLLLLPVMPIVAFPCGKRPATIAGQPVETLNSLVPFCPPFNATGQPAASVPCGFTRDGLPVGLQIVGRVGEDPRVLQACAAFEEARPWVGRRPVL